jgi:hypothetical protein
MATIGVYGGARFIGNDFVRPNIKRVPVESPVRQRQHSAPSRPTSLPVQAPVAVARPVAAVPETQSTEVFSAQLPLEYKPSKLTKLISLRTGLVALAIIVLVPISILAVTKSNAVGSVSAATSKLALAISDNVRHTPVAFKMPANAILVKNNQLTGDKDAIESQMITIDLGATSVSPMPSDIAHWVKTSAGPQKGSTVLAVNSAAIESYVASVIASNTKQPTSHSNGIGFSGGASAADQIIAQLLTCKGISVSLSSATIPPKIND